MTLLVVTLRGERSAWWFAVAWAMLLGVNHRTLDYFAENRPDMPALLMATAGRAPDGLWPAAAAVALHGRWERPSWCSDSSSSRP